MQLPVKNGRSRIKSRRSMLAFSARKLLEAYMCRVTPLSRRSWTRNVVARISCARWSSIKTFHVGSGALDGPAMPARGPLEVPPLLPLTRLLDELLGAGALKFSSDSSDATCRSRSEGDAGSECDMARESQASGAPELLGVAISWQYGCRGRSSAERHV